MLKVSSNQHDRRIYGVAVYIYASTRGAVAQGRLKQVDARIAFSSFFFLAAPSLSYPPIM